MKRGFDSYSLKWIQKDFRTDNEQYKPYYIIESGSFVLHGCPSISYRRVRDNAILSTIHLNSTASVSAFQRNCTLMITPIQLVTPFEDFLRLHVDPVDLPSADELIKAGWADEVMICGTFREFV